MLRQVPLREALLVQHDRTERRNTLHTRRTNVRRWRGMEPRAMHELFVQWWRSALQTDAVSEDVTRLQLGRYPRERVLSDLPRLQGRRRREPEERRGLGERRLHKLHMRRLPSSVPTTHL